jgi:ribosomal protein S18 acetylase RimI-like enzyme
LEKPVQYLVRNYRKGDEIHLATLFSECFGPTTPRLLMQWYTQHKMFAEHIFIGEAQGRPVSSVEVVPKTLHLGEGVYSKTGGISGVCTDSDYRKKGIVSNLMKLSLEYTKNSGASNASLYTGLDFPAHRIYQRLGFVDVMTWRTYTKLLNYPSIFAKWVRMLNRSLKGSKIARKKLEGWEKSVSIGIKEVGTLAFRFRKGRFERVAKAPQKADIEFSTDLQTYIKIRRNVMTWEDAIKTKKLFIKRGEAADIEILQRILRWQWGD